MNIWIILPLISGIFVIVFTFQKFKRLKSSNPKTVNTFEIWLFGLLALLLSFVGQVIGMTNMFDSVEASGEITPSVVSNELKNTIMWNTGTGFIIFIISIILWVIIYRTKKSKIGHLKL